jgi:SAM-dependent methyltransferase
MHNFKLIKDYFDTLDRDEEFRGGPYKRTEVGQFVPSPLLHLEAAFAHMISLGVSSASSKFLDAGCGDARVLAVISGVYSIEAVGVEYDAEMADKSLRNLDNLTQLGSKRADWQVVQGDFMDNKTYEKTGIEFQQFDIVFNYINNQRDIAMKVFEESPAGTAFWLLGAFPVPGFQGLYLERNLELVQDNVELPLIRVNDVAGDVLPSYGPDDFLMQVYRKA